MNIDRIDKAILKQLQQNNRLSNLDIAEKVGLSPPACLKRTKRLRELGAIVADVSILSPQVTGNRIDVIFLVEMKNDSAEIFQRFAALMSNYAEVTQCYQVVGDNDFLLIASLADIEKLDQFSDQVLRADDNVKRFKTIISKKKNKFTTAVEF